MTLGLDTDVDDLPIFSPICTYCRHFRPAVEGRTCAAFPDGIPREMWIGDNPHTAPVVGDHGIRFEPAGPGRPRRARRG